MNLLRLLKAFFDKVKPYGSNIHRMDGRKIFVFSFPIVVMLFLYAILTFFVLKKPTLAIWEVGCAILALSSNFLYKYTNNYKASGHLLVFSGLLILSVITFYTGGTQGHVIFWIYLCPLCAGMIIDKNSIAIWGVICIGVVIGFMSFNDVIQQNPSVILDQEILTSFKYRTLFGTIAFSMLMSFIYKSLVELAVKDAERKQSQVRDLLRLVSHDIGNSLALIDLSAMMIKKNTSKPEMIEEFWTKHTLGVQTIVQLLSQVREMESLRSGKKNIRLGPVDINKVMVSSLLMFEDKLEAKELNLSINTSLDKNQLVLSESISLGNQVFNNLISNAIKFSQRGGAIEVNLHQVQGFCIVEVCDTGVGINNKTLKNIFSPTEKTSHLGTEGERGTGFGMPLMKVFVENYGGKIEIESKTLKDSPDEHGTKIRIYLKKFNAQESEQENKLDLVG